MKYLPSCYLTLSDQVVATINFIFCGSQALFSGANYYSGCSRGSHCSHCSQGSHYSSCNYCSGGSRVAVVGFWGRVFYWGLLVLLLR